MPATADKLLTVQELAEEFGLPAHILRRFIDRHGLGEPRRYPRQHRAFRADKLAELRRLLRAEGYLLTTADRTDDVGGVGELPTFKQEVKIIEHSGSASDSVL